MKFVEIQGVKVPYFVENRNRIRSPRVEVTDRITVILPNNMTEEKVLPKFSNWMLKRYLELRNSFSKMPNEGLQLFGNKWSWFKGEKFQINSTNKTLYLDPSDPKQVSIFKKELKRKLLIKIQGICKEYKAKYGFEYGSISIRNTKSRWGSCTPENNLNFSLRLAILSDKLVRSVVYHELIHTIHKNHKKRFKAWLSKEFPNPASRKNSLNKELHEGWIYAEVLFRKLRI